MTFQAKNYGRVYILVDTNDQLVPGLDLHWATAAKARDFKQSIGRKDLRHVRVNLVLAKP